MRQHGKPLAMLLNLLYNNTQYGKEGSIVKALTMFYLEDCGYCAKALGALEELYKENPFYRRIPIWMIEESQEPDLADHYDYYAVPCFFEGKDKLLRLACL